MKKIILCSFAVLLLSGCSKTPEDKINNLYQDGVKQISNFQVKSADSTFSLIFDVDPGSILGMLGKAKISDSRLQYFDAVNDYLIILSNNTDYEDAFTGLYNAYKNLGFYNEALESAVHYNKLWNSNSHTKFILGDAYKNIGELKRAETYFKQTYMSGYEHKSAAQLMLATTIALQGDYDNASKEAKEAFANQSMDPIFYDAAAEYYETIGMIDSSMLFNKKLFEYEKSNMQNAYTSFTRALKNNYLSDTRFIMQSLESLHAEPIVIEGLGLFYALHIDDKSGIRTHGENYRAYAPSSYTGTMYELYSRAEISDKLTMAQDLSVLENDISLGKFSDEFGSFYYYAMLMLNVKYEKNPTTIAQLENIHGLYLNRKEYRFELALTKHIIGLFDECYDDLKKIESGHETDADWLTGIADVWRNLAIRKYDNAEEFYKKALTVDKNYLPAYEKYVALLAHQKKYDKVLELFDKYPQFQKNNYIALTKTKYLFHTKKYADGFKQFQQNFPNVSGNIVFVKELVSILKNENRTDEIKRLLDMLPKNNSDVFELLAIEAQNNKDFESSKTFIDEALKIEPKHPLAKILKARAMYYTGQKSDAYDLFEKNLVEFANNPQNLMYYSEILATEGIDFDKASNMARQATFEGYGNFEYLMNLADIYYKMGRYDLSRGESSKAIIMLSDNPYALYRFGMACVKSENKDKWLEDGKESLRKAIKNGLSGEYLIEANAILKK